tara:strand:- start:4098 stop:5111 length:1014 start_codon:yes stop_codon:yes gene_type:complete
MIYIFVFFLTFITIIFFSYISKHLKLIDYPNSRKLHKGPIPLVGGLSIYASILILSFFVEMDNYISIILASSLIVLILGAIDDAIELGVILRLISQLIASLIVLGSGLSILDIGSYFSVEPIKLGIFGSLLTILSVMGLTNAINFIDGIDGLCSSIVLNAFITLVIFIYFSGNYQNFELIYIIIISITSFLLVNMNIVPIKKVFLGDSGSMALGFLLSWFLIYHSHPSIRNIHPVLTIWCIALPMYDLLGVILRRLLREINPFKSDRRHIHHILIDLGLTPLKVFIILTSVSIFLSFSGGIIYFNFGSIYALIIYIIFFLLYVYVSLILSRKITSKK